MHGRARGAARLAFHAVVGSVAAVTYLLVVVPAARMRIAYRRARKQQPAILWAPIPIINIRYASMADQLFGYRSESLSYFVYSINTRDSFDRVLERWYRRPVIGKFVPYATFVWAGLRYDLFCFYFDGGLLYATPWWRTELLLLRLAGHRIVVLPYGADARLVSTTRKLGRWNAYTDVPLGAEDTDEVRVRARLETFGRRAHLILGCADLVEDLPRLDGVYRFPYDTTGIESVTAVEDGALVTVVHAPNHRLYKGTRYLVAAVEALRAEGLAVQLDLVEGVPNDEARRRYARASIVADQFLAGAYALFAIEAMALGKPVICYLNPRFAAHHPELAECPIVSANPDQLTDALRSLVRDRGLREELGARGPAYVERWHSLGSVGADLDRLYRSIW